ncbi:MAG: helix-turn-helix transcriptional regulator [Candidatus Nanopelagicales bacterium]
MAQRRRPHGGQLTLNVVPRPPADTTRRFIDYLRSEPTADEVAQELVLGYLVHFRARASIVTTIDPDATLRLVGGFGLDAAALNEFDQFSLWDELPPALTIRERRPIVFPSADQAARRFPNMSGGALAHKGIIAAPMMTSASAVGSLCVCLDAEGEQVAIAARVLAALADIYVLYLLANMEQQAKAAPESPVADRASRPQDRARTRRAALSVHDFTERQRTVLQLLAQGMTYDQIAMRIGYSHSTVRMELMAMYRAFDVSSRREAIVEAVQAGVITEDM